MNTISDSKVKTRKDHHCWGCTKIIPKGTVTEANVSADGGRIFTTYWCDVCDNFMRTLSYWDLEDGFEYGGLLNYENYPVSPKEAQ